MKTITKIKTGFASAALAVAIATTATIAASAPAYAQNAGENQLTLSIGEVHQLNLGSAITDVVVADPKVADVEVTSNKRVYILAKGSGMTELVATNAAGRTVYRAKIVVGGNLSSLEQMLKLAMPDSDIKVHTTNNIVLLTGTVAQPEDAVEAERLATMFTATKDQGNSTGTTVINRIKNATPLQINLQVRIAEVSRSLVKEISGNLKTRDNSGGGILGGVFHGRDIADITSVTNPDNFPLLDASNLFGLPANSISLPFNPATGQFLTSPATRFTFKIPEGTNVVAAAGRLFGMDVAAAFDLSERAGLISTLANPNLTTVSGETAEFLAGGSFPVVTSSNNGTSVEYKNYGVSLTYSPIVPFRRSHIIARALRSFRHFIARCSSHRRPRSAGDNYPNGGNRCRNGIGPKHDDRRSAEQPAGQFGRQNARSWRHSRTGGAFQIQRLASQRNRVDDHHHALFGETCIR